MNCKSIAYFASQRLLGSKIQEYFREFQSLERAQQREVTDLQEKRLDSLLRYASSEIPFYRDRVGHKPTLQDFPILTKDKIREHFSKLMTDDLRREYNGERRKAAYGWTTVKTGGSTGIPTTVIHDREYRDRGRAGRVYSRSLCGFPLGIPYFRLWGSMKEVNQAREGWKNRAQTYLNGEIWLNAFRMEERDLAKYISVINSHKAVHMMAYVDAAAQLARFVNAQGLRIKPLVSIMACAGTLTVEVRQLLAEAFHARVHNQYGSRDCAGIACECELGQLHYYAHNLFLEVVDEAGNPLPSGQLGRLLVTLLGNRSFSLIRYDIGDVAALEAGECPCRRPFPLLKTVEGRQTEFLRSSEGGYVSPVYIRHLIGVVHNPGMVRRFQLVQSTPTHFELSIELEPGSSHERSKELEHLLHRDLQVVLGRSANIRILHVPEIPCADSGKFLYTINRIPAQSQS